MKNENITDNSLYMYSTWNLADQVSFGCSCCYPGTNEPASSRRPSAVSVILRCYETVRQTATRKHFCLDQGLADHVTTTNEQKSKLHKNGRTHIGKNSTITLTNDLDFQYSASRQHDTYVRVYIQKNQDQRSTAKKTGKWMDITDCSTVPAKC